RDACLSHFLLSPVHHTPRSPFFPYTTLFRSDEMVLFPRLYSEKHSQFYQQYLGLKEGQDPTFLDQLNFFFNYQLGHMYARYFLRSEEHTSELQSRENLVCRLLLEKKKKHTLN